MIKIGLYGSTGRMGSNIKNFLQSVQGEKFADIIQISCEYNSSSTDIKKFISSCDVILDFSGAEATLNLLKSLKHFKDIKLVICSTGLSDYTLELAKILGKDNLVIMAPNTSIGVFSQVESAKILSKILDPTMYDCHILDIHHKHKKDSPSGTAKWIKSEIENVSKHTAIIDSIRFSEESGLHKITFSSMFDEVTLQHRAKSRYAFSAGALLACKWLFEKGEGATGFYNISSVFK